MQPFAHDPDGPHLGELFQHPALAATRQTIVAGDSLFEPDEPADHLCYIEQGQVRLYKIAKDNSRLLDILGPGAWVGVAALNPGQQYGERAVAAESTSVLKVGSGNLLQLLAANGTSAALRLIQQLASKVQSAREDAARLAFDDCNLRLVQTLVRFSRSAAARRDGPHIVLSITHHQLAQAVGAARETVSLALTQLRQQNLLRTGRNRLIFHADQMRIFERWAAGSIDLGEVAASTINQG